MSIKRLTQIFENSYTLAKAMRTSSVQEDLFIKGLSFSYRNVVTAPAATNLYLHYDIRSTSGYQVIFDPFVFVASDAGPVVASVYHTPTLTAGGRTAITPNNRRATSTNLSLATVEFVAAANVSSPGTWSSSQLIPSNSAGGALPNIGAQSPGGLPFEINTQTDYLLEIDNKNGSDTLFEINAIWFEVPL